MLQGLNNSLPLNNVNTSAQPVQPKVSFRGEETPEGFEMQNPPEKKKSNLLKWLAVGTVAAGLILFRKKLPVVGKWFETEAEKAAKAAAKEGKNLADDAGAKLGDEVSSAAAGTADDAAKTGENAKNVAEIETLDLSKTIVNDKPFAEGPTKQYSSADNATKTVYNPEATVVKDAPKQTLNEIRNSREVSWKNGMSPENAVQVPEIAKTHIDDIQELQWKNGISPENSTKNFAN